MPNMHPLDICGHMWVHVMWVSIFLQGVLFVYELESTFRVAKNPTIFSEIKIIEKCPICIN
jgi:hypothetical protein